MFGFDALGRLALAEIPRAAQTVVLLADSGVYSVTGHVAYSRAGYGSEPGFYSVTGYGAGLAAAADRGSYSVTGHDANMAVGAASGHYVVVGQDIAFGVAWRADPGAYALTLGAFELRRTGYDYSPDQYGIGHIKLEMVEARRRARIVKPTPYPIVQRLPELPPPQFVQPQVAPVQGLIDSSDFLDRLAARERAQAAQRETEARLQARNRALAVLLLAA